MELQLQRGGKLYTARLKVDDLDAITPAAYLEFGDTVVHTLSYQEARAFHRPVQRRVRRRSGYMFDAAGVPRGAVITEVNSKKVDDLADFAAVVANLGDGAEIAVRYTTIDDPNGSQLRSVRIDRRWFPARQCQRDDHAGYWQCTDLPAVAEVAAPAPASTQLPRIDDKRAADIAPSLVFVTFDMPYSISGVTERNYHGTGLIIDAERGLLVTDRNTVPVSMGDVRLTFARHDARSRARSSMCTRCTIWRSFTTTRKLIGSTPVRAAKLCDRAAQARRDRQRGRHGWRRRQSSPAPPPSPMSSPLQLPLSRSVMFRETNLRGGLAGQFARRISSACWPTTPGRVRGLWASFASDNGRELVQENRGIPSDLVAETLDIVRDDRPLHSLEAEFVAADAGGCAPTWA